MRVTRSTKPSPFSHLIYIKPGEINRMCEVELGKAGCLPNSPQPVDIELFIEKHFESSIDFNDIENGILGYTLFDKTGKPQLVGVSPSIDDGTTPGRRRMRSTFAHEAGHCMMHQILFTQEATQSMLGQNLDTEKRRIMCRDSDFKRTRPEYDGRWWEYQANCAIGGFLLPKRLVSITCEQFLEPRGLLQINCMPENRREEAARAVAETFDVNPVVARIRLEQIFPPESQETLL